MYKYIQINILIEFIIPHIFNIFIIFCSVCSFVIGGAIVFLILLSHKSITDEYIIPLNNPALRNTYNSPPAVTKSNKILFLTP